MLSVNDLSINFGGNVLFSRVDLQFTPGNCYGIIGANGAGKSTFIKILSGELEPSTGSVTIAAKKRMSVLKQNQNMYDDYTVMDTVIMGNQRLYDCGREKDAIYDKPDFDDADGIRAAELEEEFAELGGWEAESDASRILQGLGVSPDFHETLMHDMDPRLKVKVLLAQALFGSPDIILLDEPTTGVDAVSRREFWEMLKRIKESGVTIMVSTPYMDEVSRCDRIAMILDGKIIGQGTPAEIVARYPDRLYSASGENMFEILGILRHVDGVLNCSSFGSECHVSVAQDGPDETVLAKSLEDAGISGCTVKRISPGIEDCFIRLS